MDIRIHSDRLLKVFDAAEKTAIILLIVIMFCVSGCGGGGSSSGSAVSADVIKMQTSSIRRMAKGDYWEYSASGTISDGVNSVNLTGTIKSQILSTTKKSPVTGDECLDRYSISALTGNSVTVNGLSHTYFLQDANNSILDFGVTNNHDIDAWVTNPSAGYYLSSKSPVAVGQNDSAAIGYDDLSTLTYSYLVSGIENVTITLGTFEAYKVSSTETRIFDDGYKFVTTGNVWYVPAIGSIKESFEQKVYYIDVFQYSLKITTGLTATNVAY